MCYVSPSADTRVACHAFVLLLTATFGHPVSHLELKMLAVKWLEFILRDPSLPALAIRAADELLINSVNWGRLRAC